MTGLTGPALNMAGAGAMAVGKDAAMFPSLFRGWRNAPAIEEAAKTAIQSVGRYL
jgi:hypothetical protein